MTVCTGWAQRTCGHSPQELTTTLPPATATLLCTRGGHRAPHTWLHLASACPATCGRVRSGARRLRAVAVPTVGLGGAKNRTRAALMR